MKKKSTLLILSTLMSAALFSCSISDYEPINSDETKIPEEWGYANPAGVFVLNEGNFSDEFGSLIYITHDHKAKPNIYQEINGRPLGKVSQDMCFYNGRTYVISQINNNETDGMLTVMDTKTLKKEANYAEELKGLDAPSHLAVLNDKNIFIRDNKCVWRFDRESKQLTKVEGTDNARKNTMPIVNGKAFAAKKNTLIVLKAGSDNAVEAHTFAAEISGISAAGNGKLYVSTYAGIIYMVDPNNYTIIKQNELQGEVKEILKKKGWGSTSTIAAKGDTIYFNGGTTQIYRHLFSSATTKKMFDTNDVTPAQKQVYQTLAVSPKSGLVYMNTIDSWAKFKINRIYEINTRGEKGELLHKYENHTHFPAGVFFATSHK